MKTQWKLFKRTQKSAEKGKTQVRPEQRSELMGGRPLLGERAADLLPNTHHQTAVWTKEVP